MGDSKVSYQAAPAVRGNRCVPNCETSSPAPLPGDKVVASGKIFTRKPRVFLDIWKKTVIFPKQKSNASVVYGRYIYIYVVTIN